MTARTEAALGPNALETDTRIRASIGTKGTVFLTPQVWMSHLQDGEQIGAPEPLRSDVMEPRLTIAVLELQRQHYDMLRLIEELSDLDGDVYDRYTAMTDRWEVSRVG